MFFQCPSPSVCRLNSAVTVVDGLSLFVSYGLQFHQFKFISIMSFMTDNIRLPDELGKQLRLRREALGMSKSELAERAGKVREVIYRLEAGEDTTVSSLMAVMSALKLVMQVTPAGLPTAAEVARRFLDEDDVP
jgi:DNA-binding phage protein